MATIRGGHGTWRLPPVGQRLTRVNHMRDLIKKIVRPVLGGTRSVWRVCGVRCASSAAGGQISQQGILKIYWE